MATCHNRRKRLKITTKIDAGSELSNKSYSIFWLAVTSLANLIKLEQPRLHSPPKDITLQIENEAEKEIDAENRGTLVVNVLQETSPGNFMNLDKVFLDFEYDEVYQKVHTFFKLNESVDPAEVVNILTRSIPVNV